MPSETITSRQNPLLQHVRRLLSSRSYREKCGAFAADGVKLLREAVQWNAELEAVLLTAEVPDTAVPAGVRTVRVPEDVMASVSPMESPQGALFICKMPKLQPLDLRPGCLVLDGLQDPGNVGTILRTADAMDVPVVLSDGCADVWNHKTVRASMGAVFRTPVQTASAEQIIASCKERRIPLLVTALSDRAEDVRRSPLDGALVIGSEGSGVRRIFLDAADRELIIPMNPRCESLNAAAAAAIVLWEMKNRQ